MQHWRPTIQTNADLLNRMVNWMINSLGKVIRCKPDFPRCCDSGFSVEQESILFYEAHQKVYGCHQYRGWRQKKRIWVRTWDRTRTVHRVQFTENMMTDWDIGKIKYFHITCSMLLISRRINLCTLAFLFTYCQKNIKLLNYSTNDVKPVHFFCT